MGRQFIRAAWLIVPMVALAGCQPSEPATDPSEEALRGLLRARLNAACMASLPEGPRSTHYNDWAEVVGECDSAAWYQSKGCTDPMLCLRVMFPDDAKSTQSTGDDHDIVAVRMAK